MDVQPTLFTCSYSEYHPDMGVAVRITLGRPRNMTPDAHIRELAPHPSYFKADDDEFLFRYRRQLERHGVERLQEIFRSVAVFGSDRPLVLLCFERLNKTPNCHRRDFAQWWQEQTGETVDELGAKPPQARFTSDELPIE